MPAAMNKSNGYHNEAFEMHPESQVNNNCPGLCTTYCAKLHDNLYSGIFIAGF